MPKAIKPQDILSYMKGILKYNKEIMGCIVPSDYKDLFLNILSYEEPLKILEGNEYAVQQNLHQDSGGSCIFVSLTAKGMRNVCATALCPSKNVLDLSLYIASFRGELRLGLFSENDNYSLKNNYKLEFSELEPYIIKVREEIIGAGGIYITLKENETLFIPNKKVFHGRVMIPTTFSSVNDLVHVLSKEPAYIRNLFE